MRTLLSNCKLTFVRLFTASCLILLTHNTQAAPVDLNRETNASEIIQTLSLVLLRLFMDVTYDSAIADPRQGNVTISNVVINTPYGRVNIEKIIADDFTNPYSLSKITSRSEVYGVSFELDLNSAPSQIVDIYTLHKLQDLRMNISINQVYKLGDSAYEATMFLDIENMGQIIFQIKTKNIHFKGDWFTNVTSLDLSSGKIGGTLSSLYIQFINTGLLEKIFSYLAVLQDTTQSAFLDVLPIQARGLLEFKLSPGMDENQKLKPLEPNHKEFVDAAVREIELLISTLSGFSLSVFPSEPIPFEDFTTDNMGDLGLSFSSNPYASRTTLATPQLSGALSESGHEDKGRHYLEGIGVPQNFAKAARLLDKSVLKGDPIGEYNLARMLFLGLGGKKDIERAHLLASMAAARGNIDAISLLARIERKLAAPDLGKLQQQAVTHWLKTDGGKLNEKTLLAKSGDLLTMRQLAWEYFHGVGLPRSYESSYFWANLAAAAGDHFARNLRDRIIANSTRGGLLTVTRITAAQSASLTMWEKTIGPAISGQRISKAVRVPTSVYNYLTR